MDYQFCNCELTCNLLNKCSLSLYQTVISVSDFGHTCVTCIFNKYFEEEKGKKSFNINQGWNLEMTLTNSFDVFLKIQY